MEPVGRCESSSAGSIGTTDGCIGGGSNLKFVRVTNIETLLSAILKALDIAEQMPSGALKSSVKLGDSSDWIYSLQYNPCELRLHLRTIRLLIVGHELAFSSFYKSDTASLLA